MHITWHGQYTVKLSLPDTTIVIDPVSASTGLPAFRGKCDVVALSNPVDESMSYTGGITGKPIILNTPGEYSFKDISIQAIGRHALNGAEQSIMICRMDGMTLLHVGAITDQPDQAAMDILGQHQIDVFFLPVGGGSGLELKEALQLLGQIEPRVVIPIHYHIDKLKENLSDIKAFAQEMGLSGVEAQEKVILKAGKLAEDEMQTIILSP